MKHSLTFEKSISRWDEAIPLGNGRIGALVYGGPEELRFSLDRTDIWDRSVPLHTEREDFTYANLVRMAKNGETEAIRQLFDAPYNHPTPTKLPAGKLLLGFRNGRNVRSQLDLETAEAQMCVELEEREIIVQAYCHAVTKSGMICVGCRKEEVEIRLENPEFGDEKTAEQQNYDPEHREISQGDLKRLHYPAPVRMKKAGSPDFEWFLQSVDAEFSFGVIVGILEKERETLIGYRVVTSRDGLHWIDDAIAQIQEELRNGYEEHKKSHLTWWKKYWEKSKISLPDPCFERNWYLTNYLFASCSRKGEYPMPLQGVWTADDGSLPPWKGDYHNDLNTQLSYSHFYKANHLEEGESFLDFLWNSMKAGENFAKKFYQTEGMCLPGVMSIDGQPLGGWPMYSLSPIHQIWLCKSFEEYYRYTGDRTFLKEKAWTYFEETAKCITALLEEKGGQLYLPMSSSPEIHDDEKESWLTPNSNYDLALLRYLYATLVEFAEILENGQAETWKNILERLPELAVNEKHVLMLSPDESLNESHRHLSNAMAICPLHLYSYEKTEDRKVIDATILDYERLGSGMWVGFSFAWMSHLYAVQENGEGAFEQLRIFWESFCSSNGFHLNGDYRKRGYTTFHYRPFTLEANMYAADALQEMLFQMDGEQLHVFPAIPEVWEKQGCAFEGFRGHDGILVSARWSEDGRCEVQVDSPVTKRVQLKIAGKFVRNVELEAKKTIRVNENIS